MEKVRCGLREGTVLAVGRGDLEWGRQGAGRIEWDGKSGHKQYLWVYLIKMCRMSEKICIFALRKKCAYNIYSTYFQDSRKK